MKTTRTTYTYSNGYLIKHISEFAEWYILAQPSFEYVTRAFSLYQAKKICKSLK